MWGKNLTATTPEDRCRHSVNRFPSHFKGARAARVAAAFDRDHLERRTAAAPSRSTVRWGSWTRWQVASPTTSRSPAHGTLGWDDGEAARHGHHPADTKTSTTTTSCGTTLFWRCSSGKLEGHRKDCAPLAGKSTLQLNTRRFEGEPGRYHSGHHADALQAVELESFIALGRAGGRRAWCSTSTRPTTRSTGARRAASSTATTATTASCRSTSPAAKPPALRPTECRATRIPPEA